jgi:hypothetical protein
VADRRLWIRKNPYNDGEVELLALVVVLAAGRPSLA